MKRIILALALTLGLAGCASVTNAYNTLTSATVSPTAVYVAANSFDAIEITATNYLRLCQRAPSNVTCSSRAIAAIIPAVRSGRVARTNLEQFMKTHPDAIGAAGLYDALTTATSTLQSVVSQYNISGATK